MSPAIPFHPSLAPFNEGTREDLLAALQETSPIPLDGLASGAVIFRHHDAAPRVLLIQRAPADSMPLRWEIPGGAVDQGEGVLAGVCREVAEETSLVARRIETLVAHEATEDGLRGGYLFDTTRGRRYVKFTFVVQAEGEEGGGDGIRLDPAEHVDYVWATEEECRAGRVVRRRAGGAGGEEEEVVELEFTTAAQKAAVLSAFEWRKSVQLAS